MSATPRRSAHNRPALIALALVVALVCLALGWWQWERFESSSGTGQNLGYALQWPLFAGFVVFAYFRFVRLESEAEEQDEPAEAERPARPAAAREIPAGFLPERPTAARDDDPVLAEYNKYLADLHAQDSDDGDGRTARAARSTERSAG
ncbi:transcriptional regulator [Nocardia puris]|uniref:transcriptional regulator n=1 Tax=Nocardia puris TaxID=208602 RepID=UPI0018941B4A|nr:transcriptional regulator [Nocardia puris]MBF6215554.1 transcriptional regulator [Nocardia puris]MBF6370037.1 transcriptional regulator [Nocardia puris]MBF6463497.1 transcriptional regulator [Nocardia puris]